MEIFAERLRELRAERNLSQRMLSSDTGIPQSSIALWESGARVPAATAVVTLAKVLWCFDRFFARTGRLNML